MALSRFIYFGQKFADETDGAWGYLVNETKLACSDWDEVASAIIRGDNVHVRPAEAGEIAWAESNLAIEKASRQSATSLHNQQKTTANLEDK